MVRLLTDENFNGDIVRGLLLRHAGLDITRVQDVGLAGAEDPDILKWAADNGRIVLTHDRATMADFAFERVASGKKMPGMFVIGDRFPVGKAIDELLLIDACTELPEWDGRVVYLPI